MNRIHLRLFAPQDDPAPSEPGGEESDRPHILPFHRYSRATVISGRYTPVVRRAKILHDNSVCPECGSAGVEPLELDDALISHRNHQPVPGTATLVGFHCHQCGAEWPVYELTASRNSAATE